MARRVVIAVLSLGIAQAQLLPPPPPAPDPPKYEEPPEEDESLVTPKVYTFNPLQAKKEISVGDFNMKRGNYRGAAYRYLEATHWDDGNADAFFKLGEASEKLKDYEAAREAFTKYAALVGNQKKADEARKRIAKYPAAKAPATSGGVTLDEARKRDRGEAGEARAKGIPRTFFTR